MAIKVIKACELPKPVWYRVICRRCGSELAYTEKEPYQAIPFAPYGLDCPVYGKTFFLPEKRRWKVLEEKNDQNY